MTNLWNKIKIFIEMHKVASIVTASVVGAAAVGGGGFAIYQNLSNLAEEETVDVVIEDETAAEDLYIPEFKAVKLTGESIEKDLTLFIADSDDNCITGVPFQVKLVTPEDADSLEPYISAIQELNKQIAEYTGETDLDTGEGSVSDTADEKDSDEADNTADSDNANEENGDSDETDAETTVASTPAEYLQERNVDVTITDENDEVVDVIEDDMSQDPLYQLYLDKETAIEAYALAIDSLEGEVYTDDDEDGIISQDEMEPGDYEAYLVYDESWEVQYDPVAYEQQVNVKDKIEYKVVKEITKEIKADKESEDAGKQEEIVTEATLTDTVEYVASSKVENGKSYKATTAVKPTVSVDKATAKAKSGSNSVTKKITKTASSYTITIDYKLLDAAGKEVKTVSAVKAITAAKGATPAFTPESSYTDSNVTYYLVSEKNPTLEAATANKTYTYTYQAKQEIKKQYTVKVYYNFIKDNESGIQVEQTSLEKTLDEGAEYSITAASTAEYGGLTYTLASSSTTATGKVSSDTTVTFDYKYTTPETTPNTPTDTNESNTDTGFRFPRLSLIAHAAEATQTEVATLNISFSKGVFTFTTAATIDGTASDKIAISAIKVNGNAVSNNKYTVSANGDYTITAAVTYSDGKTADTISVVYTVAGITGDASSALVDANGNQLYLDAEGKTKATAADYKEGTTYYYAESSYTYYGWQSVNGISYYYDKNGNKVTGTQVIQGVSYNFGTDGALLVNGTGIDVSKYQRNIDWAQAKSSVAFAIVRCGYRGMYDGQLHEDPYFYKNMSGAKAAGVKTGIYIYSTALNEAEAVQEASMAVAMANKAGGCSYPIYIDMEDTKRGVNKLSTEQRNAIINAFCTTVQSAGYKAGVYASKNWMTKYINASALPGSCYIWVAQYNTSCSYSGKYSMWQYTSKGSVPGIKGNVDMNKSYF